MGTLQSWREDTRVTVVPIGSDRVFLTVFNGDERPAVANVSITELLEALEAH